MDNGIGATLAKILGFSMRKGQSKLEEVERSLVMLGDENERLRRVMFCVFVRSLCFWIA